MGDDVRGGYLEASNEAQREAADFLTTAARDLARKANGNRSCVTPAPVAYDLLGNLKVSLAMLNEVVSYLPRGLRNSLSDPRLEVYDQDLWSGVTRDPARQVAMAADHLTRLAELLDSAVEHAEAAQVALNRQGYRQRE